MRISNKSLGLVAAALVIGAASWGMADDEAAIAKAPSAVQATVKKVLGDKKCEGFDQEDSDGKPAYEVSYKVDGVDHSTLINQNGDIIEEEVDVELSTVPAPVTDAAKNAHSDGKIKEASIVTASDKKFYELDVKVGDDTHEMKINADGSVISDSIEKPEAGDNDKDKDAEDGKKDKD